MKKYKRYGKPWWRWWFGFWPITWICRIWNPLGLLYRTGRNNGSIISDVPAKRRGRKRSKQERARRRAAGEAEKQCFSVKVIRSLDFAGDTD